MPGHGLVASHEAELQASEPIKLFVTIIYSKSRRGDRSVENALTKIKCTVMLSCIFYYKHYHQGTVGLFIPRLTNEFRKKEDHKFTSYPFCPTLTA